MSYPSGPPSGPPGGYGQPQQQGGSAFGKPPAKYKGFDHIMVMGAGRNAAATPGLRCRDREGPALFGGTGDDR